MASSSSHRILTALPSPAMPNFFDQIDENTFVYKKGTRSEVKIVLLRAPTTAAEYFDLAMAIRHYEKFLNEVASVVSLDEEKVDHQEILDSVNDLIKNSEIVFREKIGSAAADYLETMQDLAQDASEMSLQEIEMSAELAMEQELKAIHAAQEERNSALQRFYATQNLCHPTPITKQEDWRSLDDEFVVDDKKRKAKHVEQEKQFILDLLIDATIAGEPRAEKALDWFHFNSKDGIRVCMERKLETRDDLKKFISDLAIYGAHGPYYFLKNPAEVDKLSKALRKLASDEKKQENSQQNNYSPSLSKIDENSDDESELVALSHWDIKQDHYRTMSDISELEHHVSSPAPETKRPHSHS